jgi:hypothetical protein
MTRAFGTLTAVLLLGVSGTPGSARAQSAVNGGKAPKPVMTSSAATSGAVAINLPVRLYSGAMYPSMRPAVSIEVFLNDRTAPNSVAAEVQKNEASGWNCGSVDSYAVTIQGSTKKIAISAVVPAGGQSCNEPALLSTPAPVYLLLGAHVDTSTQYVVTLVGLPDKASIASSAVKFPSTTASSLSATPAAAPNEALDNGKKRDVGQLSISYNVPFVGSSPVFINTKDLFSTDEKDTKSAFAVTLGASHGLLRSWYTPLQFSETVQGNQVTTSLSAVSNLSVSGLVPWYWTQKALNNSWIDAGLAPEFALSGQYTRRINQQAAAKTKLLAVNDASINPSLTIEPFYVLPGACARYRKWIGAAASTTNSVQYCLGIQVDLGTWYLPVDKTKAGSRQDEGYGDVSLLIPLSNLNFKDFGLVSKDGLLNSEIQIEYSDSVNAANNYARSRQWTFGIEVMK